MKPKIIIASFIVIITFLVLSQSLSAPATLTANECNICHGSSHPGHVSYTISLGISEVVVNGTDSTLSATILNSNYPLSKSTITLQDSTEYSLVNNS